MEQRALHETLNRLLWRASVKAGELDNPWDEGHFHYKIMNKRAKDEWIVDYNSVWKTEACVYFPTMKSAEKALEEIIKPFMAEHPEFVW